MVGLCCNKIDKWNSSKLHSVLNEQGLSIFGNFLAYLWWKETLWKFHRLTFWPMLTRKIFMVKSAVLDSVYNGHIFSRFILKFNWHACSKETLYYSADCSQNPVYIFPYLYIRKQGILTQWRNELKIKVILFPLDQMTVQPLTTHFLAMNTSPSAQPIFLSCLAGLGVGGTRQQAGSATYVDVSMPCYSSPRHQRQHSMAP